MPTDNRIRIANGVLYDPNQGNVTLKHANKDTVLWFTQEPGSGNNKFVQYWIAFNSDPLSLNVIPTDPTTGETAQSTARDGGLVAGQYTIFIADPRLFPQEKGPLTAGGGGIIIDN